MADDHKATLTNANAAVVEGDLDGFLVHCTDDTTWTFVGGEELRGKTSVRRWLADAYRDGPPRLTVDRMIAEGDFVTAIGEVTVHDADGTPTRSAYCDVWRFRDGRMAELRAFVIEVPDA